MATTATEHKLLIDGEWVETGEWLDVHSPYDADLVGRVAKAGVDEVRRAIDAAEHAMRKPLPAHERAGILDRVAELLEQRSEEAARTISGEAGKPMKAARVEAARAVSTFTMAAVEARKLAGDVVPMDASPAGVGKLALTLRLPVGVVAAISPFNFPLNLVAHKIAPALAAGCAVVLFSFAGQSCISVQRIYVERTAYEPFLERFLPKVEALVLGDPADEDTDVGPLISSSDRDRVLAWIEEAKERGATVLTGGALEGDLLRPTVVADAPPDAKLSCEEVFGPLCTVAAYDSLDDALALANGTRFGLQAGVFTRDVRRALRVAQELEFGGVTVNEAPTFRADQMPYGGVKDSGNTREGPAYAVREMTDERVVVLQL